MKKKFFSIEPFPLCATRVFAAQGAIFAVSLTLQFRVHHWLGWLCCCFYCNIKVDCVAAFIAIWEQRKNVCKRHRLPPLSLAAKERTWRNSANNRILICTIERDCPKGYEYSNVPLFFWQSSWAPTSRVASSFCVTISTSYCGALPPESTRQSTGRALTLSQDNDLLVAGCGRNACSYVLPRTSHCDRQQWSTLVPANTSKTEDFTVTGQYFRDLLIFCMLS